MYKHMHVHAWTGHEVRKYSCDACIQPEEMASSDTACVRACVCARVHDCKCTCRVACNLDFNCKCIVTHTHACMHTHTYIQTHIYTHTHPSGDSVDVSLGFNEHGCDLEPQGALVPVLLCVVDAQTLLKRREPILHRTRLPRYAMVVCVVNQVGVCMREWVLHACVCDVCMHAYVRCMCIYIHMTYVHMQICHTCTYSLNTAPRNHCDSIPASGHAAA